MILFKYILALLLTVPMIALGLYLFVDYMDLINGKKKARRIKEEERQRERKRTREKGFTIHIPDSTDRYDNDGR